MINFLQNKQSSFIYKIFCGFIALTFSSSVILPPAPVFAQTVLNLPVPGTMVSPGAGFMPALMTGVTIHPDNPLRFDFIMDRGQSDLTGEPLKAEYQKIIKYFMASLTVPEEELWVNLSPYEKDRMIAEGLGQTEMGRDMLAQDYLLKQLTASLMYPEEELGKEFWNKVYQKAREKFGTTEIPVNTFNKVWIIPDEALVYEQGSSAFVIKSRLAVMLEQDYKAMSHTDTKSQGHNDTGDVVTGDVVTTGIIREIIIPAIEKEVNEGKNFANLRQIYNALILATWYKQRLKGSLLGKVYIDQNKTKGIDTQDKEINQKIYDQYIESFKKGVYNFIKEDVDPATQEVIPRKYFSGGMAWKLGGLKTAGALAFGTLLSFGSPALGDASALAAAAMGGDKDGVTTEFVDNATPGDVGTAIVIRKGSVQSMLLAQKSTVANDERWDMSDENVYPDPRRRASSPVTLFELDYGDDVTFDRILKVVDPMVKTMTERKTATFNVEETDGFPGHKNLAKPKRGIVVWEGGPGDPQSSDAAFVLRTIARRFKTDLALVFSYRKMPRGNVYATTTGFSYQGEQSDEKDNDDQFFEAVLNDLIRWIPNQRLLLEEKYPWVAFEPSGTKGSEKRRTLIAESLEIIKKSSLGSDQHKEAQGKLNLILNEIADEIKLIEQRLNLGDAAFELMLEETKNMTAGQRSERLRAGISEERLRKTDSLIQSIREGRVKPAGKYAGILNGNRINWSPPLDLQLAEELGYKYYLASSPIDTEKEIAGGRKVGDALHAVLSPASLFAGDFLKGGYRQPGYGVEAGAVIDGSHAVGEEGNQGYYVNRTNVPDGKGGFKSGRQVFVDTVNDMKVFFARRAEFNKPVRVIIKTGIGGQHTPFQGMAGVFERLDSGGNRILGEYELGKDFESYLTKIVREMNIGWDQIAVVPSSKSGSTDETMIVFTQIIPVLLGHVMQTHVNENAAQNIFTIDQERIGRTFLDYLHTINFKNGKELPAGDLFKNFNLDDLVSRIHEDGGPNALIPPEWIKQVLGKVLGNMFFETTDRPAASRLSAFIRNSGLDRILGKDAPGFGAMFDNVGGRWTGDLHMMTFLSFYNLDPEAYWQVRYEGIRQVRAGTHQGNAIGNKILNEDIKKIALVVPDEYFWFGKSIEQNFNESIWQPGFANLRAIRQSTWEKQKHYYEPASQALVLNLTDLAIADTFNVVNIDPVSANSKEKLAREFGRLLTTFYGMTYTVGTRLIARALFEYGTPLREGIDVNDLNNPATKILQENLFLRQPFVELGKNLLEKRLTDLQAAQQTWISGGRQGISPIAEAVKAMIDAALGKEIRALNPFLNVGELSELVKRAAFEARQTGKTFVPFVYLAGEEFVHLRDYLQDLGVEWVLQGSGDQHISWQQVLAQPHNYLPFIISFVPENDRMAPGLPAIGFAKGYLDNISPHMVRDYFAEASYQALVNQGGEGIFMRILDTQEMREEIEAAFETAFASSPASSSVSEERVPTAARLVGMEATSDKGPAMKGGIDLNPALLDLQIKRDDNGVPLPLPQQPVETMHIEGFLPVILNIVPINNLPLLLGLADTSSDTQETRPTPKAREIEPVAILDI